MAGTGIYYFSTVTALLSLIIASHTASLHHGDGGVGTLLSFDQNEDGVVNGMELYGVLTLLDGRLGYTQAEARTILQLADANKDNQLDILELVELEKLIWTEHLQH